MIESIRVDDPVRVAVMLPSLHVGGAERLVIEELTYLKDDPQLAFELHLVFEQGSFFSNFKSLGIPVWVWDAPHNSIRMLARYAAIVRHLRRSRCQVLHTHLLNSIGPLIGWMARTRVLSTVHNDVRYSRMEQFVLGCSHHVLGCGAQVADNIRSFLPRQKVSVLPNAVASPVRSGQSLGALIPRYDLPANCRLLVSLGRLVPAKGYDVLIEAFRRVASEEPDAVLIIGGDGPEMARLQELAHVSGVGDRIRMPGIIRNIHDILSVAEIYVNSSRVEGLPMTLLEAMGHSLPMVATRVGGNAEVVRDGVTGLLVPSDNPDQLADSLLRLMRNKGFRHSAGIAAHDLFRSDYSIENHCALLKAHYLELAVKDKS